MNAAPFAYRPLTEPDAIRLLVLEAALDRNDALQGALLHTTLSDCDYELIEPYTALSYVWGEPTQTETIYISGYATTVTATLASALRHLRDGTRPRRIWADALCIDQSNIPERNKQVTLMGTIYRVAAHTVIFLGPSTQESDLVLESAPRSSIGVNPLLNQARREAVLQAAKRDILTRPWFHRVWIFQELILSRDPWVQCGGLRVRWTDLCSLLLYNGAGNPVKDDDKLRLLESMNRSRQGSNAGSMLSLLQARRGLGATDARDFVFAHMGIASDRNEVGNTVPVDYGMPLGRVFARMSMYIVRRESVETLVSLIDQQAELKRTSRMPSWAVDWSVAPSGHAPMYVDNLLNRAQLSMAPEIFLEPHGVFGVVGHSAGSIEDVSVTLPMSATLDLGGMHKYQDTVSKISSLYSNKGGVYYTGDAAGRHAHVSLRTHEQEHRMLCDILVGEWMQCLQALVPEPADGHAEQAKFLSSFRAWAQEQTSKPRVFVTRESTGIMHVMWRYLHPKTAASSLDGRKLATTRAGHVGIVPAETQKGDRVVNVVGSQVSLVLRPATVNDQVALRIEHGLKSELQSTISKLLDTGSPGVGRAGFVDGVALPTDASPVEHYVLIGSCCFDGQVPWAVTQLPGPESLMVIYALH